MSQSRPARSIVRGLVLVGAVALTVWQVRRSPALEEARVLYPKAGSDPAIQVCLRRATDYLDKHPGDPEASRIVALCLSRLRFAARAEPFYETAENAGRVTLDDLHTRAVALKTGLEVDRAVAVYKAILARVPDDPDALQSLAAIKYGLKQYKEALPYAERLGRLPGHRVESLALIASIEHELLNNMLAADAEEKLVRLDPELSYFSKRNMPLWIFWSDFATDLVAVGRAADARRYLTKALEENDDPVLWGLLGRAYRAEGKVKEAEECLIKASEADLNLFQPWRDRGLLEMSRNRPAKAVEYLQRASVLAPDDYVTLYNLSLAHRRQGHKAEADRYMKRAKSVQPEATGGMGAAPGGAP